MTEPPEVNIARRVLALRRLEPPINILSLLQEYADVEEVALPIGADGVCLNLKDTKRRPLVLLNSNQKSEKRKRFTLAHEFGHVMIPWHVGSIVDLVEFSEGQNDAYWFIEAEANRFASEILMPIEWVREEIRNNSDPPEAIKVISDEANVSWIAANIKINRHLPPNFIHAVLDQGGMVIRAGKSDGTLANPPRKYSEIDIKSAYPSALKTWSLRRGNSHYIWWRLPEDVEIAVDVSTGQDWKAIFAEIYDDLFIPELSMAKLLHKIVAIISYANGRVHGSSASAIAAAAMQRLDSLAQNDLDIRGCLTHSKFSQFLASRIQVHLVRRGRS